MNRAILVDKEVIIEPNFLKWANWFETGNRRVANKANTQTRVSTVFLGMDHGFGGEPLWFETMIFGGEHDEYQDRCTTYDEALVMHEKACELAFGTPNQGTVNNDQKIQR